ncbi:MAG: L,D-transpeptidase family protein, partial [Candidatus Dormibacteraeota bacterium]|nr:L,D-transpeptidase family protein [Candidatus Dormibacteraeota bacterium]
MAGAAAAVLLAGCSLPGVAPSGGAQHAAAAAVQPVAPAVAPKISISPGDQSQNVPLDAPVQATTDAGHLTSVTVQEAGVSGPPAGQISSDGTSWQLGDGLDSGATYTITATAVNGSHTTTSHVTFSTLTAQARLLTTFTPYDGSVVGIGEPIDLNFNTPIPDSQKAEVVQHIQVASTPGVMGSWHWFTDSVLHFRPENYWPSGTKVTVNANLKGVNAGNGVWGLGDWSMSFTVGPKHLSVIDDTTHTMQVYSNDQLVDTWPVSLGKAGFPTLSGTLVVLYKSYVVKMSSCGTFGGAACVPGNVNFYDENVYYDTAISTNGFFIHAAPWSVYAQGHYDVSHGCVDLSTDHAISFYN